MKREFLVKGNIVDVVSKRIYKGEISVIDGRIKKICECESVDDVFICPGFIDAHIHIESTMLTPNEFSKIAVKHGTVAVVTDPHEIANVLGVEGIDFMIEDSKCSPVKFYFGAPSCVPATGFETSGCVLDAEIVKTLLERSDIYFLSEMMNFPGVVYSDKDVMDKINSAKKTRKPIDGHAPGLNGEQLIKYAQAGITTDHESVSCKEAEEKIKLGINLQIREGSAAKNFESLYSMIDIYPNDVMLCTDDTHPDDLLLGHINKLLKRCVEKGLDIFNALRSATYNPVKHYNLNVGLLQPGDCADFVVVDNLENFNVLKTYIDGILVFENGNVIHNVVNSKEINKFSCNKISVKDIEVNYNGGNLNVIEAIEGELITKKYVCEPKIENGKVVSDLDRDILKIVVLNRYDNTCKPSVGFIKNFGFKKGAIAGSIAHDSHNIIAIGASDEEIVLAVNKLVDNKGGITVAIGTEVADLKLGIAGLMTNEPAEVVAEKYNKLNGLAISMGSLLRAPFMTMAFMALLVIPELKIGDKGLFDVTKFSFTNLFEK